MRAAAGLFPSLFVLAVATTAAAQPAQVQIAEEPTGGLDLGPVGISGEHDGLATSTNPAGLQFLSGADFNLVAAYGEEDGATAGGQGFGLFYATALGGGALPRIGQGFAFEWVRPSRVRLSPDPGTPLRMSTALSLPLGRLGALGVAWRHFFDDGALGGLDTFDLGLARRFGAHLAAGFVIRDLGEPTVGGVEVERRYELELTGRPTGDDRLELSLGGRIGENRSDLATGEDLDGWARLSVRTLRGVYLRGQLESRSLFEIFEDPAGVTSRERRELRLTAGLEISFGPIGAASHVTSTFGGGDRRLAGGTTVVRLSERPVPSLLAPSERIERLEIAGSVDDRKLLQIVLGLRRLARDPTVKALVLQVDGMRAGWATTDELRRELLAVRKAGKKVYAYLVAGSTRQYYLVSAADKVYVDPAGGLRLYGFSSDTLYFKGLFDKLGVVAQFEKIEEYKSAPEAYTRTGPTEPAFTQRNELYDSLYEHLIAGIAESRKLSAERVRTLIDNGPYTAGELRLIPDLVDAVVTPEGLGAAVARDLGRLYPVGSVAAPRDARWDYPAIAVIYIDGDIVDGKSQAIPLWGKLVGGETISTAIAAAAASREVDAIVLRIDSPGGSALASEMMAREVFAARARKPIICSMGDVAASGGYFAAAGCDTIFADPMTITGSIGIFNGKFDLSGLFGSLGITWSSFKRGRNADVDSAFKPYSEAERSMMKQKLHYYYGRFISAVARGRGISEAEVDAVGRGHVWTGRQALPIKLVDQLGGLGDAIALAKQRIGRGPGDEVRIIELPRVSSSLLGRLFGPLVRGEDDGAAASERVGHEGRAAAAALLEGLLPAAAEPYLRAAFPASLWFGGDVPQARLPFAIILSE
jgi:protease IV